VLLFSLEDLIMARRMLDTEILSSPENSDVELGMRKLWFQMQKVVTYLKDSIKSGFTLRDDLQSSTVPLRASHGVAMPVQIAHPYSVAVLLSGRATLEVPAGQVASPVKVTLWLYRELVTNGGDFTATVRLAAPSRFREGDTVTIGTKKVRILSSLDATLTVSEKVEIPRIPSYVQLTSEDVSILFL